MKLGHFSLKIGLANSVECIDLGIDENSYCVTHEGVGLHADESRDSGQRLHVGDTVKITIDIKRGRVDLIVNGKSSGFRYESEELRYGEWMGALQISQGTEVRLM